MHWTEVLFLRYLVDCVSFETLRDTTCLALSDVGTVSDETLRDTTCVAFSDVGTVSDGYKCFYYSVITL